MPTLKTIRKLSNQVLTSTSWLGSEPSGLCTVKGIAQGTAISAAAEDSLPHGRLSSERKEKERADDGGREKWKPNVWHFKDSDSLRRIKCELRSRFSWFSLFSTAQKKWLQLATNIWYYVRVGRRQHSKLFDLACSFSKARQTGGWRSKTKERIFALAVTRLRPHSRSYANRKAFIVQTPSGRVCSLREKPVRRGRESETDIRARACALAHDLWPPGLTFDRQPDLGVPRGLPSNRISSLRPRHSSVRRLAPHTPKL